MGLGVEGEGEGEGEGSGARLAHTVLREVLAELGGLHVQRVLRLHLRPEQFQRLSSMEARAQLLIYGGYAYCLSKK